MTKETTKAALSKLEEAWKWARKDVIESTKAALSELAEGHLPKEILNMDRKSIDLYKKALQDGKISVHNIRVMVVGQYDVGKTTLTKRLLGEPVDITKRASTNGIDVHVDRCKISLKDGTWSLTKSDNTRKAIFHQLAKLFNKDGKQAEAQSEMNATSDTGNVLDDSSLDVDKAHEQTTSAEHPVAEIEDRAETEIYSRIQTASVSRVSHLQSARKNDELVYEKYAQSMRHLKKFIENVQIGEEHLEASDLSLWDFAGQNVFYATHQVFFSRRAIYLLVTNISKHIDETVDDDPWHADCSGETKCKVSEYIDFWLNSIHEFCSYQGENGPPVVLVGTFADQLKRDISPDDACISLREFMFDKAASCHLTTENFIIDNTVEDENIQSLRKHIFEEASKQAYWGENIPAKWVTLEDVLIGINEENIKVLHKDKLKELNMTLPAPIETDEELELFLQFHHEIGNIIYFSKEDVTNYILLDPQWLIDAFKSVITAKSFCINRTNIKKEWMEFERTAVLKQELIDAVWEKRENSDFKKYKDLLLTYMVILGLVARPVQQEEHSVKGEDWYFVPCMLKEPAPKEITSYCDSLHRKSTSKLCYTTAVEPERRFYPATIFNKLLAACLQKWPLSDPNRKPMIFCGGAVFKLKENHFLYIFFFEHVIQIWISRLSSDGQFPDISLCTETKDSFKYIFEKNTRMHSKIIPFVKCQTATLYSNENMFELEHTEDFTTKEVVCYCQDNEHVIRYRDLAKYWLHDQDLNHSLEFQSDHTSLTEKDFSKIASRIGEEYVQLGWELGLTKANLDQIKLDNATTRDRIVAMLCEWKERMADKATTSELRRALSCIGKDPSTVL
ncbi:uncharacterized protein LOC128553824 [Mercenaria mercenaria]|uniref:uncharacterized protein LOC128553824 n=1 Tax=Mercenaria mercenaria TaxID=6596 RepID=UPI00234F5A35|nr:uncharacterized protein LOC128553824 [Mercenaria mercenaria]